MNLRAIMLLTVYIISYNLSIWVGMLILILKLVTSNVVKIGLDYQKINIMKFA